LARLTFITVLPCIPSPDTRAFVPSWGISALATILTRTIGAFVNIWKTEPTWKNINNKVYATIPDQSLVLRANGEDNTI